MKKILPLVILIIAAVVVWKVAFQEPAPAKQYREYRKAVMAGKGFNERNAHNSRWSLKIESCETEGSTAVVTAVETTARIPPNAASFTFATIVTRKLEVELELQGEKWVVSNENVLDETVSTFEDRKYGKQDTQ
jgi:hypothetical protein